MEDEARRRPPWRCSRHPLAGAWLYIPFMRIPTGPTLLQVVPRDGLSVAADLSIVIVAIAVVALAVVIAVMLARINAVLVEVRKAVGLQFGPVSERARGIAENVEFITRTLRGDVEKLNSSVTSVTDKLKLASERMEERIEDFNALMEVVQEEAEDVFIDTAATVRGVRAGARSLAGDLGAAADVEDAEDDHAARVDGGEQPGAPEPKLAEGRARVLRESEHPVSPSSTDG